MDKYELLKSLLPFLNQYEQEKSKDKEVSVEDFAVWMNEHRLRQRTYADKRLPVETQPTMSRGEDQDVTLSKLVYYMYRYARFYSKKALKNNPLNSLDEFSFLVTLLHIPTITKTELIHKMIYDKTSGIELINRLIKQGMIMETENPADKRSKLIQISDLGRQTLFGSFEELTKVSRIIPGKLTSDEVHTLIHLLDKLDHHHLNIWAHHKESDLDTILRAGE
jgi:DNA-binding MarR family transcriptional regulator